MKNTIFKLCRYLLSATLLLAVLSCQVTDEASPQLPVADDLDGLLTVFDTFKETVPLGNGMAENARAGKSDIATFVTFRMALTATGLHNFVSRNQLTIFAPTDEAFEMLGYNRRNIHTLPGLRKILLDHMVEGKFFEENLPGSLNNLNGNEIALDYAQPFPGFPEFLRVNGFAFVIKPDIPAQNGVVHATFGVLLYD